MKIGIMLRHYEQHSGGVKVYTLNVLPRLLAMDHDDEFVLMYQNPALVGTYSKYPNVKEVSLGSLNKLTWDQVVVPWYIEKEGIDLVFNMKFSIPFFSPAKKLAIYHGFEWFVIPETFLWYDRLYTRAMIPLYCRSADRLIAVSNVVKDDIVKYTRSDPEKINVVYYGIDASRFKRILDQRRLEQVKQQYGLPDRFILWVGQLYPPKNVGRLLKAFGRIKDQVPHQLVIAGEQRWRAESDLQLIEELGLKNRIQFSGWVSHDDLPVFYNLADLFAFPSLYEGFGIPLLEAMACGCPILTSKTGTPPEVVGEAGFLVDPLHVDEIVEGLNTVLSNPALRAQMCSKGLERVKPYTWDRCARLTLYSIENFKTNIYVTN